MTPSVLDGTRAPIIVAPAGASTLWELPRDLLRERSLFHGTLESFDTPLGIGGYDSVCWTALGSPAIAQTYIPATGLSTYVCRPRTSELGEIAWPTHTVEALLAQMGRPVRTERDATGRVTSFGFSGEHAVRNAELVEYVEGELGYTAKPGGSWQLRQIADASLPGGYRVVPATYRAPARLFVLLPQSPLRLYNHAGDAEGDLTDVEYHDIAAFRAAEAAGFDGVVINDFCQSPSMGNVGHKSYGLFPSGLAKCASHVMAAGHYDIGTNLWEAETPDFIAGHRAAALEAQAQGQPVPPSALGDLASSPKAAATPVASPRR